jgi:hypothetical protein
VTGSGVKEPRSGRLATADADLRCRTGISSATPRALLGAELVHVPVLVRASANDQVEALVAGQLYLVV